MCGNLYSWDSTAEMNATLIQYCLEQNDLTDLTKSLTVDLGCGDGKLLGKLKEIFPSGDYLGIDKDEIAIAMAKAKFPEIDFRQANIESTRLPTESVSLVTSVSIIDYANGALASDLCMPLFAREVHRILQPGGVYIPFDIGLEETYSHLFVDRGLSKLEWIGTAFQK